MAGMFPTTPQAHPAPARHRAAPAARPPEPQPVHAALICVALPALAISSAADGQLTGRGMEGFYRSGRRVLARCVLRVAGAQPLTVQARPLAADRARFTGTLRTPHDPGPDPGLLVERLRTADGTERITLHNHTRRALRLPLEITFATDLAELGAVAGGLPGPDLPASVHDAGLRWATDTVHATVTADPPPDDALAAAGLLRWGLHLPPGAHHTIELRIRSGTTAPARPGSRGSGVPATGSHAGRPPRPWSAARLQCEDPRASTLLAAALDDLGGLLIRDHAVPADACLAAGVPWRCGLAPAESLSAARMLLPLGTGLAASTLRVLARTQHADPGPEFGRIPGPLRDAGPHSPPSCTGIEATLLFPAVLAEARRWGLPTPEVERLLPAAERCLTWLRRTTEQAAGAPAGGGCVPDPAPTGPYRCETQAHAHRAALLGADLLDACNRPGGDALREGAAVLRRRFRDGFWIDDAGGGRPAALCAPDGRPLTRLVAGAAHLLDTGLLGAGTFAPGLLDSTRADQVARLLNSPALDTGWGLRGLGGKEDGYNPFGHRSGAVRVQDTAVAASALAAAGHEAAATSLIRGLLDAAESFGYRLPEMYSGQQRTGDGAPVAHPTACRPAAVAAAGAVHALVALAGIRPDVPGGTLSVRPVASTPLGALHLTGLTVAERPFAVHVSGRGLGMVEEAADGLQLGA
ncbi:glycogen debranching N-terminal domain-containing protein [Streptomyces sp. NPDC053542]|uniref:glycogen debranching N-terminal domain-containing protein n=1 Tax=Streptomyces sp. NPDC053542 TaxID=3365710 RepID=UPI0037D05E8A